MQVEGGGEAQVREGDAVQVWRICFPVGRILPALLKPQQIPIKLENKTVLFKQKPRPNVSLSNVSRNII